MLRRRLHLVVEDAAEVVAVREDVSLARQVGAATVNEVHAGQPAALCNLLQPQVLLRAENMEEATHHPMPASTVWFRVARPGQEIQ